MNDQGDPKAHRIQSQHLSMLAIGGSIGTGLFVASGQAISCAGAGGALSAYAFAGLMVYFLMQGLAELVSKFPSNASFCDHGRRFIHPSVGFALGWNYWFNWAVTLAVELSTVQVLCQFWSPSAGILATTLPCLLAVLAINLVSARGFGAIEYWISMLKVGTILLFIGFGSLKLFELIRLHGLFHAFQTWTSGGPWFAHGLTGWMRAALLASFAFQGTELIGVAAAETEKPDVVIPKVIKGIFWRIFLFYICSNFLIATLLPFDQSASIGLERGSELWTSPFTRLFSYWLGRSAGSFINFILLSSVFSSANSGLYASARMLKGMADQKMAPSWLARCNDRLVPVRALLFTLLFSIVSLLGFCLGYTTLYRWLIQASTLSGLMAWIGMAWSHLRFRRALVVQKKEVQRGFVAPAFPYTSIVTLGFCTLIGAAVGYEEIFLNNGSQSQRWIACFSTYASLLGFCVAFLGHRFWTQSRRVKLEEISLEFYEEKNKYSKPYS